MKESSLVSIEDLVVAYEVRRGKLLALNGVNLEIPKNSFIALVGESGCGKSTLALSIIGLLATPPARVERGSIWYKSTNLLSLAENERRWYRGTEMAMIFQEPLTSLNPVHRIGNQISEAIRIRKQRKSDDGAVDGKALPDREPKLRHNSIGIPRASLDTLKDETVEALRLVRIPDPEQVIDRYPFELSGGMRQRVMIAMALSERPSLLIADEPTTALDVTTQAHVLRLMRELMGSSGTSILLITHDLAVASQVADRVVVMYAGNIVEDSNTNELFAEPLHPYTKGLLACIPSGSKDENPIQPITGNLPEIGELEHGCKYAPRCPFAMTVCESRSPDLVEARPGHKVACFLYD